MASKIITSSRHILHARVRKKQNPTRRGRENLQTTITRTTTVRMTPLVDSRGRPLLVLIETDESMVLLDCGLIPALRSRTIFPV